MGKRLGAVGAAFILALALAPPSADASIDTSVVSDNPANYTPRVTDDIVGHSAVYALAQSGDTIYAGGKFQTVTDATSTNSYTRTYVMAFSATTGAMAYFAPVLNNEVWAVLPSGNSLYIGGKFTTVNGIARPRLVKVDATTGVVDQSFNAKVKSGRVSELAMVNGRLIVGGSFEKKLMALDPDTGADTGYINLPITGTVGTGAGATEVFRFSVDSSGTHLVAVGNFTSVGTTARSRVFMLNLGADSASLASWYYQPFQNNCRAGGALLEYVHDVDFSPDGSYFVVAATGYIPNSGGLFRDVCDAAARFETNISSPTRPTWINYTGGDTLHAVVVTGGAVYIQGHQRWVDNPFGNDFAGSGAKSRPGIAALNNTTGAALDWNPGKTRGVGGREFLATPEGLWVGSDGKLFHGEDRDNIAFCPAL